MPRSASAIGTTIEWYDFFLYNTAAALIFPHVFFPASTAYAGAMQSFATYRVGFAARPIGAAIFGHWGDRIGRKTTLIITLLVMGIASAAIGILPGTASIGVAAPLILVVAAPGAGHRGRRRVERVGAAHDGMGGPKQARSARQFRPGRRPGRAGARYRWDDIAIRDDVDDAFDSWGWRVPFLASLILVAIGLVIRLKILETPMFTKVLEQGKAARTPVLDVIRRHWREILLSAGLRFAEQMPFYLFTTFVLIYVVQRHHYSKTFVLTAVLVGAAVELATIPFFSHLSDSVGRRRVYLAGAVLPGSSRFRISPC